MPERKDGIERSPGGWESGTGSVAGRSIDFIEKYLVLPDSREPVVLHPYQRELIEQWADPSDKCHATVIAAGNAKTATLAAYVVSHLFLSDEASVPVVAATMRQAWDTTLGRAKRMIELTPELDCRTKINVGQSAHQGLQVKYRNSYAFAVADKPDGLQGLNPSLACLEEMSEASIDTFSALINRLGKRPTSKMVGISTPSFTEDNALLHLQRLMQAGTPMPGVKLTEHISDQKDHRDESQWYKANPALMTTPAVLDIEALRTSLAVLPEMQFRAYRLAQNPTGSQSCWLNSLDEKNEEMGDSYDIWKRGVRAHAFKSGALTWAGVDVSKSFDHTAVVWGQFNEDGTLHVKCRVWTPSVDDHIDLEEVAEHLRWLQKDYDLQQVWYDPSYFANAPLLERELPMVSIPPTDASMAPLVLHAYDAIRRTRITHDDDDQLTKPVLAAKRKYCASGFTLEKKHYAHKIDAAIALVLCHGAATGIAEPRPDFTFF